MHIIHDEIGLPKITSTKKDDNTAVFVISPLPSGFGMTLGNALRRVLLSSVPGVAVTAIKVEGASHEYATLGDMKDSVLDLALNLKRLVFSKKSKDPEVITLACKGEGDVTGKDVKVPSGVEVLNKDHVLTTLDKKGSDLKLQLKIEKGVGYLPATERTSEDSWILLDAIFSPVKNVKYEVSQTRVGKMTNLDRLELEVTTNGAMTPQDAVKFTASVLQSYFSLFQKDESEFADIDFIVDFDARKKQYQDALQSESEEDEEKEAYTPIEVLNLSPRTLNALINGNIGSVEELIQCKRSKLDTLRGFGKKAMDEVGHALESRSMSLPE